MIVIGYNDKKLVFTIFSIILLGFKNFQNSKKFIEVSFISSFYQNYTF